jgi:cell division protein FtsN
VSVSTPKTLSRDFKHVKRHTPGGAPAFNGWVGLGVGLGLGLAVALAVHLKHTSNDLAAGPEPATDAPPASAQAPTEVATPPAESGPDLTFYDMLPKQEVEVPSSAAGSNAARSALPQGDVTLQAGSFKNVAEAEKLQAQLAQYGVDAKIQRFSLEDETWFRVRIGPIATVEELDTVRAKLAEAEVEATPVTAQPLTPLP